MPIFRKGIVLTQYKEPAFSKPLVRFTSPQDASIAPGVFPPGPVDQWSADALIEIAKAAQIVDERDGKYLYRKLLRAKGRAVAVIADAIDDEPYVSSQINPMLKLKEESCGGLALCDKVAQSGNVFIMAYKNVADLQTRIPSSLEGYPVVKLHGGYPAEPRMDKLRVAPGRKLIVGAGALIHFYRAVTQRVRQATAFVTVAGNCVANPMNLEVSLGMTVGKVLERCGLSAEPTRVVCGGPMTGVAIIDADMTAVTPTTRAVLAFQDNLRNVYHSCIGCGRCEQVCPQALNPMYIYRFTVNSYFANLQPFDAHLCIGCGTCSYVCPSKLNVSEITQKARQYALAHFLSPSLPEDEEEDSFET